MLVRLKKGKGGRVPGALEGGPEFEFEFYVVSSESSGAAAGGILLLEPRVLYNTDVS